MTTRNATSTQRTGGRIALLATALTVVLAMAAPAAAREPVDPATLNPAPPDFFNASCFEGAGGTVCTLAFDDPPFAHEPSGLICDGVEILASGARSVVGKRFYDGDGNLVRRHFRESLEGTYVNPQTGRHLYWEGHDTVLQDLAVPGDLGSGSTRITGLYVRVWRPDGGTVISDTGTFVEDAGTFELLHVSGHHPFIDYGSDPSAIAPLCEALD